MTATQPDQSRRSAWPPAAEALLTELYPNAPTSEICNRLGRSKSAVQRKAALMKLERSPEFKAQVCRGRGSKPQKRLAFIDKCADLLNRPTGAKLSELVERTGVPRVSGKVFVYKAARDGQIFASGKLAWMRYFLTAEAAADAAPLLSQEVEQARSAASQVRRDAANHKKRQKVAAEKLAKPPKPPKPEKVARAPKAEIVKQPKAPKPIFYAKPKPVSKQEQWQRAAPIIPANVKKTVCPTPPDRWAVVGLISNGFKSLGIGHYMEATA